MTVSNLNIGSVGRWIELVNHVVAEIKIDLLKACVRVHDFVEIQCLEARVDLIFIVAV